MGSGGDEGREGKVESNGLIPARFAERVKGVRLASAVNVEWGCDTKDVQKSRSQTRPQDFPHSAPSTGTKSRDTSTTYPWENSKLGDKGKGEIGVISQPMFI